MVKIFKLLIIFLVLLSIPLKGVLAQESIYNIKIDPPLACNPNRNCPDEMDNLYPQLDPPERCATSYQEFLTNPIQLHYWIEDPKITEQGKADERARQFLYWTLNTSAVDDAPVLRTIWNTTSIIALFGIVLIVAIFGIGYILSKRTNYNFFTFNIQIWPTIIKIVIMLLYVALSAAIVFLLIQLSEILMRFFIDTLGGKDLFNIYFTDSVGSELLGRTERSYKEFIGCRDLNIRVQEGISAEIFLLKMTNVSYYVMGVMLILRKILLWFLLFVSPFLALLMPFVLIRNTGWIWIGVFFQWLFYGPLLALFLGAMAKIWSTGIPFRFDFSRVSQPGSFNQNGYVYPTGINIVYGGPAQRFDLNQGDNIFNRPIGAGNNGNYIDTFAEYVITLIMLWAVTFFPWWLLRIFRDYCCEGIYAMKNILLAMYDQLRGGGPSIGPTAPPPTTPPKMRLETPMPTKTNIVVSLGSLEQIRNTISRDIVHNLSLSATKITDIAQMETNKQVQSVVNKNITNIANPVKAKTPAERQQFMNLRSELFARAIKNDTVARTILASTSATESEKIRIREEIVRTIPQAVSLENMIVNEVKIPREQIKKITYNYTKSIVNNNETVNNIARATNTQAHEVKNILNSYTQNISQPMTKIVTSIAKEQRLPEQKVKMVLSQSGAMGHYASVVAQMASEQKIVPQQVTRILSTIHTAVTVKPVAAQVVAVPSKPPVVNIEAQVNIPAAKIQEIMTATNNSLITNNAVINQIAKNTHTTPTQVQSIVHSYTTNIAKPTENIIQTIAQEHKVDTATAANVIAQTYNTLTSDSTFTKQVAQTTNISQQSVQNLFQALAQPITVTPAQISIEAVPTISTFVSEQQKIPEKSVHNFITNLYEDTVSSAQAVNQIAQNSHTQVTQVQSVLNSFIKNVDTQAEQLEQTVGAETHIDKNTVNNIMKETNNYVGTSNTYQAYAEKNNLTIPQAQNVLNITSSPSVITQSAKASSPAVTVVSVRSNTSPTSTSSIVNSVMQQLTINDEALTKINNKTQVSVENIKQIITTFAQNIDKSSPQIYHEISSQTNISKHEAQPVLQAALNIASSSPQILESVTQSEKTSKEKVQTILGQTQEVVTLAPTITENISTQLQVPEPVVKQFISSTYSTMLGDTQTMQNIAQKTSIETSVVQTVINSYIDNIDSPQDQVINNISQEQNINQSTVAQILQSSSKFIASSENVKQMGKTYNISDDTISKTIVNTYKEAAAPAGQAQSASQFIANSSQVSQEATTNIIQSIMNEAVKNEELIQNIKKQTNLQSQQIKNVITTFAQNINQPGDRIVENIHQSSGIPKEQVQTVLVTTAQTMSQAHDIIKNVAAEEGVKEEDVTKTITSEMQLASSPEEHIEKSITIPQSVSLEDYEQVKEMWAKHYEDGEVPISDTIKSRTDWIGQEIVYITNTLNKLLSPDEKLRQEGLDELGFLLPIFLINNLKGEELLVYLKAKLEAAKIVQRILEREETVKEKMKKEGEEEELVEVKTEKEGEEAKPQEMAVEEEEKVPQSIEERVKAVQEKLEKNSISTPDLEITPENPPNMDEIKKKISQTLQQNGHEKDVTK